MGEENYRTQGYDRYGMRNIKPAQQLSANAADYFLEVSENSVRDKNVKSVTADKLTAGTITVPTNIGSTRFVIDGELGQMRIYDPTGTKLQTLIQ
jgi:hypothetical protein